VIVRRAYRWEYRRSVCVLKVCYIPHIVYKRGALDVAVVSAEVLVESGCGALADRELGVVEIGLHIVGWHLSRTRHCATTASCEETGRIPTSTRTAARLRVRSKTGFRTGIVDARTDIVCGQLSGCFGETLVDTRTDIVGGILNGSSEGALVGTAKIVMESLDFDVNGTDATIVIGTESCGYFTIALVDLEHNSVTEACRIRRSWECSGVLRRRLSVVGILRRSARTVLVDIGGGFGSSEGARAADIDVIVGIFEGFFGGALVGIGVGVQAEVEVVKETCSLAVDNAFC
jgi:hypothetical protein